MNATRLQPHCFCAALGLVLGICGGVRGQPADPNLVPQDGIIPEQALVRLAPGTLLADVIATIEASTPGLIVSVQDSIASRQIYLLHLALPAGVSEFDLEGLLFDPNSPQSLVQDSNVPDPNRPLLWGELEYANDTAEGKTGSGYVSRPLMTVANYQTQYVDGVLGLSVAAGRVCGAGSVVAVLDTGVDGAHAAFGGRVLGSGFNFVSGTTNTNEFANGVDDDGDGAIDEMFGHGTFVAGLIARAAPGVKLLPVTVLNSDGGSGGFRIAKGLYFAIDRGVEVINMSLGSTYQSIAIEDAVGEAKSLGIVVVGATGNFGTNDPREFPAMMSDAFGVIASDDGDLKATFSNFGGRAFITAPGTSARLPGDPNAFDPARTIYSTIPGDRFAAWEGTSVAAPFVSAAAALIRAQHPEWAASGQTWNAIDGVLSGSAVDIYPLNPQFPRKLGELGAGRLDIAAAVNLGPLQPLVGDLNNDDAVGLTDLAIMLAEFGAVHSSADFNSNGSVDIGDLAVLLLHFGAVRPAP